MTGRCAAQLKIGDLCLLLLGSLRLVPAAHGRAGQDYGRRRELAFRPNLRVAVEDIRLGGGLIRRLAEDAAGGCGFT